MDDLRRAIRRLCRLGSILGIRVSLVDLLGIHMGQDDKSLIAEVSKQLRFDEGVRKTAYADHLGYLTIGVGRLIDAARPGAGLRDGEIEMLLRNDILDRITQLENRLPWFRDLDEPRQGVLINMAFQLGIEGLLGFKTTLSLIAKCQYYAASEQMLLSKWANQTPKRANRLAQQMKTGRWVLQ